MTPIDALIYGVIEGITEFLPISSTGHLILTAKLLGQSELSFVKSFEVMIQLGAILAVVVVYFKKLLVDWESMKRVVVGFIPTGILGLTLYKAIKGFLESPWIVVSALAIGGVFLIAFERWYTRRPTQELAMDALTIDRMTYRQALWIGLAQSVAMIPGVSRSAATIIGGMAVGLSRTTAVEFSFLLAVPTMAAATLLDLLKNYHTFTKDNLTTLSIGFVVSFLVALAAIRWLLSYVRSHTFTSFGWYRIVVAFFFTVFVLLP